MRAALHMIVSRLRACLRRGADERDFDQELAEHLAMAEAEHVRRGLTREEARRAARVELGGLTQLREAGRAARGLTWLGTFWLDLKLGGRRLRKFWGLTLTAGLTMTVVIFIAASTFSFLDAFSGRAIPLEEGDRVVAIETFDPEANRTRATSLGDFARWRDTLRTVEDVGAFRTLRRELAGTDGPAEAAPVAGAAEPVSVAEITAAGFRLARVPALFGRTLLEEDERAGAAPALVIGHDAWRSRFAADPEVVGRRVRLGGMVHTIVGVMPEDFAFPVNHGFWTPLPVDAPAPASGEDSGLLVFARLAPGVSLEGARAELAALGVLPRAAETGERLQPRLQPYAQAFLYVDPFWSDLILLLVSLLLVPPCANIAILVYARTVARQEEFAVRAALGGSRGRIVGQVFLEILLLAGLAAGLALLLVHLISALVQVNVSQSPGATPFWMDFGVSPTMVLYAAGLAVLAAIIAGAGPAFRATGRLMHSGLRSLGSRTGLRLGPAWTFMAVAQIAFALAVLPSAAELQWGFLRPGILGPGFAAGDFLTARLHLEGETPAGGAEDPLAFASRFRAARSELVRRLEAEPGVSGVTVASVLPGEDEAAPFRALVEVEEIAPPPTDASTRASSRPGHEVRLRRVDEVFFEVFDVSLLAGRRFEAGDFAPERTAVIVNQTLAEDILASGAPLGRRLRYLNTPASGGPVPESELWYEIVGVVADLPAHRNLRVIYHPQTPAEAALPVSLALRAGPDPAQMAGRLREIAAAVDPALRLDEVRPLDEIYRRQWVTEGALALVLGVTALSVLLLSAAGLYALMSFIVNQRQREIGIRLALGAQPARLLAGIFKRALVQIAGGVASGLLAAWLLDYYLPLEQVRGLDVPVALPAAAALMIVTGVLAAAGPALRALRTEPTEALKNG